MTSKQLNIGGLQRESIHDIQFKVCTLIGGKKIKVEPNALVGVASILRRTGRHDDDAQVCCQQ